MRPLPFGHLIDFQCQPTGIHPFSFWPKWSCSWKNETWRVVWLELMNEWSYPVCPCDFLFLAILLFLSIFASVLFGLVACFLIQNFVESKSGDSNYCTNRMNMSRSVFRFILFYMVTSECNSTNCCSGNHCKNCRFRGTEQEDRTKRRTGNIDLRPFIASWQLTVSLNCVFKINSKIERKRVNMRTRWWWSAFVRWWYQLE